MKVLNLCVALSTVLYSFVGVCPFLSIPLIRCFIKEEEEPEKEKDNKKDNKKVAHKVEEFDKNSVIKVPEKGNGKLDALFKEQ
jgi:hypothetical protein